MRDQLVRRAQALSIGDPLDEANDYGPFINERFLENWIAQRGTGVKDGAEILLDGKRVTPGDEPQRFSGNAAERACTRRRGFSTA